ncbi:hypothetical protein [Streptomyces profundus]|uniref:hypothetical protein n=1 Tax=Streptomyces profundus TaxID=2867410 RepID=UPI001D16B0BB|nr:hypothetical protein [Streptomyces sp. MA3_2.13]UED87386.1 hypothetical protein K4G22_26860 [Streptomyces sp. MA3_2.13]
MSGGKVVWWVVLGCLVLAATPLLALGTVAVREGAAAIAADALDVNVETVVPFRVTDPRAATGGNSGRLQALEPPAVVTPRDIGGDTDRDVVPDARPGIGAAPLGALEESTGGWGIGVDQVDAGAKGIEPVGTRSATVRRLPRMRNSASRVG